MSKRKLLPNVWLVILLITIAITPKPAFAAEKPLVYVDPQLIENLLPGEEFMISVRIANITNLYALEIMFRWDTSLLECSGHTVTIPVEDYPEGVLHEPTMLFKDVVDATAGTYWLSATSMGDIPTFNGTGTVFEMAFHVKGMGQCTLEIYSSDLADSNMPPKHLDHNVQHGYFINFEAPPAKISVYPEKIIDQELVPCKNFSININLKDVYDLYSFEFSLTYNTTVLDVLNVTISEVFPQSNAEILETEGKVVVSGSEGAYTGNLTLAMITFHVTDTGESSLDLHAVTLMDVWSDVIDCEEPSDGYFNNMLITRLYVNPAEIFDPTLVPGSEVSIDITTQNVFDLYSYHFNLTYEPNILTCLGALIKPPNTDPNFVTEQIINDEHGFVWINVTYFPPAEPIDISNANMTTIYFQIQGAGCSYLNLTDTEIQNCYGESLSHELGNGRICAVTRDVAITAVQLSCEVVYAGGTVNITVVASNEGNLTETFNVTTYYDDSVVGTQEVVELNPNENTTLTFVWNTAGLEPCNNYTIKAEADQVPYETELENNVCIGGWVAITMLGDIVAPYGVIDIYDIVAVTSVYGSRRGDPNWFERSDVAPLYGIIDIYDVVTVAARYGTTCP